MCRRRYRPLAPAATRLVGLRKGGAGAHPSPVARPPSSASTQREGEAGTRGEGVTATFVRWAPARVSSLTVAAPAMASGDADFFEGGHALGSPEVQVAMAAAAGTNRLA